MDEAGEAVLSDGEIAQPHRQAMVTRQAVFRNLDHTATPVEHYFQARNTECPHQLKDLCPARWHSAWDSKAARILAYDSSYI